MFEFSNNMNDNNESFDVKHLSRMKFSLVVNKNNQNMINSLLLCFSFSSIYQIKTTKKSNYLYKHVDMQIKTMFFTVSSIRILSVA